MDIVHELGNATAARIREHMADPPTDAAVRSTLRILVEKDQLRYEREGPRYVYFPTAPTKRVRRSALRHVVNTFFGGSLEGTVAALLDLEDRELDPEERERLRRMIEGAQEDGL